ncbi:MAG: hypothetical protein R3E50_08825 [Halioglobus sp.]
MLRLLPILIVLATLGGCSVATVVSSPFALPDPATSWKCTPINPAVRPLPADPCFRAVLTAENEITLQWRVTDALPQVYIYDDFGAIQDIGFKSAVCPEEPRGTCSTRLRVKTGGFRRWLLGVEGANGARTNVAAAITVPSPFAPKAVYGGGFVDMLSPTERTVTWIADDRNAPCQEIKKNAWIEREGSIFYDHKERYPRCGRGARFTIPAAKLSEPGARDIKIRDCHFPPGSETEFCSPYVAAGFQVGSDRFVTPSPVYTESGRDLTVAFTARSGDVRRLSSHTLIRGEDGQGLLETGDTRITIPAERLTPGVHEIELASCVSQTGECAPPTTLQVLVDADVAWELERDYTQDFMPGIAHDVLGLGEPLDITFDSSGGIWLINEFSNAVEYVSPTGTEFSFTVPLARNPQMAGTAYRPVNPFAIDIGINKLVPTYRTSLGERITEVGSTIWFTQGGGMLGPVNLGNHSRVISFDPSLVDSPDTPFDDRLCTYNVPTDDAAGLGNNQVIGLSATAGRIWIAESRSLFGKDPSALSSFVADAASCENLLNFDDPLALGQQALQYCGRGQTPEQDRCMEKILLDDLPPGFKVAHLATDPVDGSLWFTDARGGYLGHYRTDRDPAIRIYALTDDHSDGVGVLHMFGGFPWSLRVDEAAVYFGEYTTRHILRFDKASATFDEIWVPGASPDVALHSLDIDRARKRLWFTLSNEVAAPEDKTASTIGYIDLPSWNEHLANPASDTKIAGVIYRGLDRIPAAKDLPDRHQSFRGIAVDPGSGKIAIATSARRQITELTPIDGF